VQNGGQWALASLTKRVTDSIFLCVYTYTAGLYYSTIDTNSCIGLYMVCNDIGLVNCSSCVSIPGYSLVESLVESPVVLLCRLMPHCATLLAFAVLAIPDPFKTRASTN
jgi:hypothetical protein